MTSRIARRIARHQLITLFRREDGGIWIDAELQPNTSYGYPQGRRVEYVCHGGLEKAEKWGNG